MCGHGRSAKCLYSYFNKHIGARNKKGGILHLVDYTEEMIEQAV
jgi:hypothetical protein